MRSRTHRQEVRAIAEYITAETAIPPYLPYPRFMLKTDLSQTAKLLYALLLDRSTLSQRNGWQDDEGRVYIVYPVTEIAEMLDKGRSTIQDAMNELAAAGLMERKRTRFSTANRIYVKVPPAVRVSVPMTAGKPDTICPESRTYDVQKTGLMMSEKLDTNNYSIEQLKENQTKRERGGTPTPYGEYQNIFLSESEYAGLKAQYPDTLERLIGEMSEYIAAEGKNYASHAAALKRWAKRDRQEKAKKGIPDYSYKEGESL